PVFMLLALALAAPTGKAAMRMAESLIKTNLPLPESIKQQFAALQPSTLHSLLKREKDSPYYKHNRENPLPYDVIIIDEASMIDAALFAKMLEAIAPSSRLLLLGDKDQLASVEAGSLFGDLCRIKGVLNRVGEEKAGVINSFLLSEEQHVVGIDSTLSAHLLAEHITELRFSHRFQGEEGIGRLSKAIIQNSETDIAHFIAHPTHDVQIDQQYDEKVFHSFIEGYEAYICEENVQAALQKLGALRVLCAVREGEKGLYQTNRKIEKYLTKQRWLDISTPFYENRPIIITRNYYSLGLFNGDIGIVRTIDGETKVWFETSEGGVRGIAPVYLQDVETVFAMTVHKSQGSEYDRVLLVLPDSPHLPLLTRELLYTAVTRAKTIVVIQGRADVLYQCAKGQVKRASGIAERFTLHSQIQ
ncbi:MAG: exodeoxyribonuclease V subunit alpha, partial [Chitinophagaceae bacterium]